MDILDNKSPQISTFFAALDDLLSIIKQALQNRTLHLNGEKFLTNKDVCGTLHISSRTLQDWRDTGQIQFIRIKGKILYRKSEIVRLLEDSKSDIKI